MKHLYIDAVCPPEKDALSREHRRSDGQEKEEVEEEKGEKRRVANPRCHALRRDDDLCSRGVIIRELTPKILKLITEKRRLVQANGRLKLSRGRPALSLLSFPRLREVINRDAAGAQHRPLLKFILRRLCRVVSRERLFAPAHLSLFPLCTAAA